MQQEHFIVTLEDLRDTTEDDNAARVQEAQVAAHAVIAISDTDP